MDIDFMPPPTGAFATERTQAVTLTLPATSRCYANVH